MEQPQQMDQRLGDKQTWILLGLGAVVVVALIALVWSLFGGGDETADADHPDGIAYYCPQCKKGFVVSNSDYRAHQKEHWGEPIPCPACGHTPPDPGVICPHCQAVYARDRGNPNAPCPQCGKTPK